MSQAINVVTKQGLESYLESGTDIQINEYIKIQHKGHYVDQIPRIVIPFCPVDIPFTYEKLDSILNAIEGRGLEYYFRTDELNKTEAYAFMKLGFKVSNPYFTDEEYLHWVQGKGILTEDGFNMSQYWDSGYLSKPTWYVKE